MSKQGRQLHLNTNILNSGKHDCGWRVQEDPLAFLDVAYYQQCAKIAERGTLDALFLADGLSSGSYVAERPWNSLEPTVLLAAIGAVTERIGLIATASSSFNDPYNLARRFASLDHISGGRVGWNIVTTHDAATAANFGADSHADHDERYGRAEELVQVAIELWDSWEDGAVIADKQSGVFTDLDRVHAIEHRGERFAVRGPLNVPRSPQGRPVLIQAGSSPQGRDLAARYAEAIFTVQNTFEEAQAFYAEMKQRAARFGRNPEDVLILPGLLPIVGSTEEEAKARKAHLDSFLDLDLELERFAARFRLDQSKLALDAPLPDAVVASVPDPEAFSVGFQEGMRNLAKRERLTVRELILSNGGGHRQVVGAPEQIADTIEHWFSNRAADGFNLSGDVFPSGLEAFVDHVIPLLRARGIFRHEYEGSTLREHFGLPRPATAHASAAPTAGLAAAAN
jgi:FMN-dependent oxidoreductase (nitrilotriacetate monooxygenase family)